jgi:hypothetical protein
LALYFPLAVSLIFGVIWRQFCVFQYGPTLLFRAEVSRQVRPHQALAMETPESAYRSSPRPFPGRLPEPEYGTTMKVRHVFKHGQFLFNRRDVFLSKVLHGEPIGLLPIDDRYQRIYLAWYPIARLDTKTMQCQGMTLVVPQSCQLEIGL